MVGRRKVSGAPAGAPVRCAEAGVINPLLVPEPSLFFASLALELSSAFEELAFSSLTGVAVLVLFPSPCSVLVLRDVEPRTVVPRTDGEPLRALRAVPTLEDRFTFPVFNFKPSLLFS